MFLWTIVFLFVSVYCLSVSLCHDPSDCGPVSSSILLHLNQPADNIYCRRRHLLKAGSLKIDTALEHNTRVVRRGTPMLTHF
jgi:hypothetical protein